MNKDLDCCTHYNRQGYYTGYVMLPVFRVRICPNCGARMDKEDEHEVSEP